MYKEEMNAAPSFSSADVERYKRLRVISKHLNQRIVKTIPREALVEIGNAIGILRNGKLVFENEDMSNVLMDCCLYDWVKDGKTVVQRYAETQTPPVGTDEHYLLQAYLKATFRILFPTAFLPGAGAQCRDVLSREDVFIMDIGLSQGTSGNEVPLATRTIPLGDYWMTGGAALPTDLAEIEAAKQLFDHEDLLSAGIPDSSILTLAIIRASLDYGAAKRIRYQDVQGQSEHATKAPGPLLRPFVRVESRNRACPCGSGKRYKRCCGAP